MRSIDTSQNLCKSTWWSPDLQDVDQISLSLLKCVHCSRPETWFKMEWSEFSPSRHKFKVCSTSSKSFNLPSLVSSVKTSHSSSASFSLSISSRGSADAKTTEKWNQFALHGVFCKFLNKKLSNWRFTNIQVPSQQLWIFEQERRSPI